MGILSLSSTSSPFPSNKPYFHHIWSAGPKILTRESVLHFIIVLLSNRASIPRFLGCLTLLFLSFIIPQSSSFSYRRTSNDGRVVGFLLPFALISIAPHYSDLLLYTSLTALFLPFSFYLTLLITAITSIFFSSSDYSLTFNSDYVLSGILVPAISAFVLYCAPNSFTSAEVSLVSCGVLILIRQLAQHASSRSLSLLLPVPIAAGYMAALLSLCTALISCKLKKTKRTRPLIPYGILFGAAIPTYVYTYYLRNEEPVRWLLSNYIFATYRNVALIAYWSLILLVGLTVLHPSKFVYQYGRTTSRKIFHLYAMLIYVPAIYFSCEEFLIFASLLAFSILCILDSLPFINPFEQNLLDTRDTASIALTHLYLLVGITAPVSITNSNSSIGKYAGIISLGVMDSVAAIVGSKYGRNQWKNGFGRTVEGTAASVAFMLVVLAALKQFTIVNAVSVVMVALLEAHSSEIDNLVLPLYFLAVLNAW